MRSTNASFEADSRPRAPIVPIACRPVAATSSTKKAAKLAGKGKGRSVRFQGGRIFPMSVLVVLVLGVASIAYARQSIPGYGDGDPVTPISEYRDVAIGFDICGEWQVLEYAGEPGADGRILNADEAYRATGVYAYGDEVVTVHPYAAELADASLDLGAVLGTFGITIADDALTFPADQLDGAVYTEGESTCSVDGSDVDAELSVVVWDSADESGDGNRYISKMDEIPIDTDGMVMAVAFVPRGDGVALPPSVSALAELQAPATTTTTTTTVAEAESTTTSEG